MITIRNIISNLSKGQSAASTKYILQGLHGYYESIKNKIQVTGYDQDSNSTTIYFQIPSNDKKNYYDVVIWMKTVDQLTLDTDIKVFSNSPVFAYNFCYTFYQDRSLLFPEKYPADFKNLPSRVRNPWQIFSFDKHIYSSVAYIRENGLKTIINLTPKKTPIIKTFVQKKEEMDNYKKLKKWEITRIGTLLSLIFSFQNF